MSDIHGIHLWQAWHAEAGGGAGREGGGGGGARPGKGGCYTRREKLHIYRRLPHIITKLLFHTIQELPQIIHSYTLYKARTHYIKPRQRYPKTSMRGRLKIALAPDCTSAVVKSRGLVLKTSFRAGNRAKPLGRSSSFSYSRTKTTSSTLSSLGVGRQRAGRGLWVGRGNHPKHATPHQSHGHSADSTNADTPQFEQQSPQLICLHDCPSLLVAETSRFLDLHSRFYAD